MNRDARPVMLTLVRGDSNVTVRHNGQSYRVCVYRTARGWSSFVESARYLEGCTGHQTSVRAAWLAALRIVADCHLYRVTVGELEGVAR